MIAREKRADLQIDSSTLMTMCTVVDNLYFILHQVNSQCHIKLIDLLLAKAAASNLNPPA
jgi:hypothetical protein